MTATTFRLRGCFSARCVVRPSWLKRCTAKQRRAGKCGKKWRPNGRRCTSSRRCRKGGLPNATGAILSSFGDAVDSKALTTENAEDKEGRTRGLTALRVIAMIEVRGGAVW